MRGRYTPSVEKAERGTPLEAFGYRENSIMRRFISSLIVALFCVTGSATFAQFGAVKEGAEKAGSATKEAGKATAETAKKAGKATAETTKDAAKATGKGARKVGEGTKNAVQTTYVCADGTTDQATVKTNACREHGGVKPEAKRK